MAQRGWQALRKATRDVAVIGIAVGLIQFGAGIWFGRQASSQDARRDHAFSVRLQVAGSTDQSNAYWDDLDLDGLSAEGVTLDGLRARNASLRAADLSNASLREADLSGSDLRDALLFGSDLTGTSLRKADLSRAVLSEADLSSSDLSGAVVDGANFWATDLQGSDLSQVRGAAEHQFDYTCWNESTKWPSQAPAVAPLCPQSQRLRAPRDGESWTLDLGIRAAHDDTHRYDIDAQISSSESVLRVRLEFVNVGTNRLTNVSLLLRGTLRPAVGSVQVFNSSNPNGFVAPPSAVQMNGEQVEINLGDYVSNGNAFVYIDYRLDDAVESPYRPCSGRVDAFVAPDGVEWQVASASYTIASC